MVKALFIDEEALKAESILNDNIDPKYLKYAIKEVQSVFILPLIGTALNNELEDQIDAANVTPDNQVLLEEYIQPCMVKYSMYELTTTLSYKFQNKNVANKNSENSSQAGLDDLRYLQNRFRERAEWYAKRLADFLCANTTKYPKYKNQSGEGTDAIEASEPNYNCGMYLGQY